MMACQVENPLCLALDEKNNTPTSIASHCPRSGELQIDSLHDAFDFPLSVGTFGGNFRGNDR